MLDPRYELQWREERRREQLYDWMREQGML